MDSTESRENLEEQVVEQKTEDAKTETNAEKEEQVSEELETSDVAANADESEQEDFKSKYYYLAAELENTKKRFQREKENLIKYSNDRVLSDIIEVVDNFERVAMALENDDDPKVKNLKIGIDMVKKQFVETLSKHGLEPINTVGTIFDPNVHEAMGQEEAEGKKEQEVLREFMKGYTLNGRVLRAAKVIIVKNEKD